MSSPLGRSAPHESAVLHVTGRATYVDDVHPAGTLVSVLVTSPHAHATVLTREATAARALPGVHAVVFADDIPGDPMVGAIVHDEPLLATDTVHYLGQPVALVVAESYAACRAAAQAVIVRYAPLSALTDLGSAIDAGSFHAPPHVIARGDVDAALERTLTVVETTIDVPGQDHFYLETQAALAIPEEGGTFRVLSSTQHPSEVQKLAASVLGIPRSHVDCEVPRLGGGFGGKESQASHFAVLAVLGASITGRPVKVWLDRDADMRITGKRHPFRGSYRAGFDNEGRLVALDVKLYSDAGWSLDLSLPVLDRAMFHIDNAYYLSDVRIEGRACRTNLPSNTAFRGFGGPQGIVIIEDAIQRYAERTGRVASDVQVASFYGDAPRNIAPYGQPIPDSRCRRIWEELSASSAIDQRRQEIAAFNDDTLLLKRGIAFQPVKFGISFTKSLLNQAGALVVVYADGSVQLNHSGTEMGQGLYTKMIAVCADALGLDTGRVRQMITSTEKVPNTSPTAASSGSDLNGAAILAACATLRERMAPVAADVLGCALSEIVFRDGRAGPAGAEGMSFEALATECWLRRVSLSATGFYATPGVAYDHESGSGTPFFYYAYGGAVVEVEVHGLTGEHRVRRVDILHDVGDSLVPSIDRGQVEGAFVQGLGWLTSEEVLVAPDGQLLTHGPSTYKIPAVGDVPLDFRVALLDRAAQPTVVGGSKAVGEPPFMLAIGIISALRDAISAFGAPHTEVELTLPCTPEAILRAVETSRSSLRCDAAK